MVFAYFHSVRTCFFLPSFPGEEPWIGCAGFPNIGEQRSVRILNVRFVFIHPSRGPQPCSSGHFRKSYISNHVFKLKRSVEDQ